METIKDVLQKNLQLTSSGSLAKAGQIMSFPMSKPNHQSKAISSHSHEQINNDKRTERLFLRLAAIYGALWSNTYKTEAFLNTAKQEWHMALKSFDNITVGKAIDRCRESVSYPPSLPMFVEICKSMLKRDAGFMKKEEGARGNPDIARQSLANIKAFLKNQI